MAELELIRFIIAVGADDIAERVCETRVQHLGGGDSVDWNGLGRRGCARDLWWQLLCVLLIIFLRS